MKMSVYRNVCSRWKIFPHFPEVPSKEGNARNANLRFVIPNFNDEKAKAKAKEETNFIPNFVPLTPGFRENAKPGKLIFF